MRYAALALAGTLLAGCSTSGFRLDSGDRGLRRDTPAAAPEEVRLIPITAELVAAQLPDRRVPEAAAPWREQDRGYEYRVGPQDVLSVIVWEHPELTIPAGEFRTAEAVGHRVSADGTIFFPYVGIVEVGGLTVEQIRERLRTQLERYIPSPQLDIRVAAFRSQKVYITGAVTEPGNQPITDVPLRLVDAVNAAGGPTELADSGGVLLIRGNERRRLSLLDILERGDLSQNVLLHDGDVVHVLDNSEQRVFVLGEVVRQAPVYLHRGRLTLADALAESGGVNQDRGDAGRIFVLRDVDEQGATVYHLDSGRPESLLLAARFPLAASDVVFVSPSDVTGIERVMRAILPIAGALDSVDSIARNRLLY